MNLRERFEHEAAALWGQLDRLGQRIERLQGMYARDADPRVARLVQSAAFAFAVAENRLHDDGQSLVRPLVARALPECLRPRPSSTIVELTGGGPGGGVHGGRLAARDRSADIPFDIVWPVVPASIGLDEARIDWPDARRQVLRIVLSGRSCVSLGLALPDVVRVFVDLEPRAAAIDLVHALRQGGAGRCTWLDGAGRRMADHELRDALRWVRVDTTEPPLVSARQDRFASGTLLGDLFAFPESFCFFDLELGPYRERSAERVELVLPLARAVADVSDLSSRQLRLFCAPATNQFMAAVVPIADTPREALLGVAGKPHAEVLDVQSLVATSARDARVRTPLRSWEAPATPHTFDADDTYFMLEQRLAVDDRTELRVTFGRLDAFPAAPGGTVEGQVLACDGAATATLGLGDIGSADKATTNITRITPSRRAILGDNRAWRMSAYARMASGRLAQGAHLDELLSLHDKVGPQDAAVRIPRPAVLGADQAQEHELVDGALSWGDLHTIDVDPGACSDGVVWLVGELLHRAIAERAEALRFCRVVLRKSGAPFAEYAARQGTRLSLRLG